MTLKTKSTRRTKTCEILMATLVLFATVMPNQAQAAEATKQYIVKSKTGTIEFAIPNYIDGWVMDCMYWDTMPEFNKETGAIDWMNSGGVSFQVRQEYNGDTVIPSNAYARDGQAWLVHQDMIGKYATWVYPRGSTGNYNTFKEVCKINKIMVDLVDEGYYNRQHFRVRMMGTIYYSELEPTKYTLSYRYTGVIPSTIGNPPSSRQVAENTNVSLTIPNYLGYTFSGWNNSTFGNNVTTIKMPSSNIEFTGSWTANTDTKYEVRLWREKR